MLDFLNFVISSNINGYVPTVVFRFGKFVLYAVWTLRRGGLSYELVNDLSRNPETQAHPDISKRLQLLETELLQDFVNYGLYLIQSSYGVKKAAKFLWWTHWAIQSCKPAPSNLLASLSWIDLHYLFHWWVYPTESSESALANIESGSGVNGILGAKLVKTSGDCL